VILAIDIGNTRIKWGVRDGERWLAHGSGPIGDAETFRDIPAEWPIDAAWIANVAGETAAAAVEVEVGRRTARLVWVHSLESQCGVRNGYLDPKQLGVDRWMALIAARHLHSGPCLVVCAGTATTIDVLDRDGWFGGGLILPGLDLMRRALARDTARLGLDPGRVLELPRTTADAIASGCMQAQLGAIERQFACVAGQPDALCIVSGGAGLELFDRLCLPGRFVDNLVLEGLALAARRT
jgi:type III pantothenate kinase